MCIPFLRKALIVVLVLCFFITQTNAQTYTNKPSSLFSFSVGLTSSNLYHDSIHYKPGILFNAGLGYSLVLNDRLNIAIEALFSGKAFKTQAPIIKYRCGYVDIPVYAQIKFGENIRVNVGAQYSIGVVAKKYSIDPTVQGLRVDNIDIPESMEYGFLGGLEFDITKNIGLGARYTMSAYPIFESNKSGFGVFQFSIKYSPIKTYRVFFGKNKTQQ